MKKILSILLSAILAASALGISASARTLGDGDGKFIRCIKNTHVFRRYT